MSLKKSRHFTPYDVLINVLICAVATAAAVLAVLRLQRSDFGEHFNFALNKAERGDGAFLNLFHDVFNLVNSFADRTVDTELLALAAGVAGFFELLLAIGVLFTLSKWLSKDKPKLLYLLSAACVLLSSAPFFFYTGTFYTGIGGINTWHNPTSFAVKPFIILSFFLIVTLFEYASSSDKGNRIVTGVDSRKLVRLFICLAACLFFMTYGKISGLAILAPATMVFAVCWWAKSKFSISRFKFCLLIAAAFIPALVQFFKRYFVYFPAESESQTVFIGFDRLLSPEVGIILFRNAWILMLPIFIILIRRKQLVFKKGFFIAGMAYLAAFVQSYMFRELGPRQGDGNESWGRHYAAMLLLLMCATEVGRMWSELKSSEARGKKDIAIFIVCIGLMLFYVVSGAIYLLTLLKIRTYYF